MTKKLYMESRCLVGYAVVTRIDNGERPAVMLDQTLFHPAGGGQKADVGDLLVDLDCSRGEPACEAYPTPRGSRAIRVHDVRHAEDRIGVWHYLDTVAGLTPGTTVGVCVDGPTRRRHARLHSAGHLIADLAPVLADRLVAVRGHHWPGEARVEFEGEIADPEMFATQLQASIDGVVGASKPVLVAPDAIGVRHVSIAGRVGVPCGGTHVESTGDLVGLTVRKAQTKKGVVRVSYGFAGDDIEI